MKKKKRPRKSEKTSPPTLFISPESVNPLHSLQTEATKEMTVIAKKGNIIFIGPQE